MYMKLNKSAKYMWLRAQTLNQKLKHNAQAQDAGCRQAFFCVLFYTFRGHISTSILLIRGLRAPITQRFRWGSGQATCSILKGTLFDISRRLHTVKFVFYNFTLYLWEVLTHVKPCLFSLLAWDAVTYIWVYVWLPNYSCTNKLNAMKMFKCSHKACD